MKKFDYLTPEVLASMIDHTFLKAAGDANAVKKLCREAKEYRFACAMVNPCEVATAVKALKGSEVRVGTVIGFPLGQNSEAVKRLEAVDAITTGADIVDYVINVRALKAAAAEIARNCKRMLVSTRLAADLAEFVEAVKSVAPEVETKIIIETCYLTDAEKVVACLMAKDAGFDFVKTSTGFGSSGATVEDVKLMRKTVGRKMGVKAAGGIRDLDSALALIDAGANRLGCSASVDIVEAFSKRI